MATDDFAPDGATGTFGGTPTRNERSAPTELGTVIAGRYTLVEVIGEGGMGSVYLASQTEPVKRQVAVKLIKAGMDSKGVLARFDAERQALALMDHPNIARIYDGGVTPAGQPFFVMELVQGVALTEYCDTQRLTVDARLQLFVQVCQAVQHAHQKGIIHRDLKPGNVLVTEVDGRPTPKVIDFGVAKATELKLTDQSFSDTGAIVGTPAYMSPEQADPSSMDIDTRADVYALGVVLYELLVGSPPIDASQFKRGAVLEMLRMVREVEPPRPSTRLSTADALPDIAANRSTEPARLAKLLQGELDWVVMKALEKDRTRRYDSANGFAADIRRYLADEVVEARPPSTGYRLKKFVKRNKAQVLGASLVLLALVAGIVGTTWQAVRAEEAREDEAGQRALADARWVEAEAARAAEARRAEAERRANDKAQKRLVEFKRAADTLGSVFSDLHPLTEEKEAKTLRAILAERLERAADAVDAEAVDDPLVVADLQTTLGASLVGLGKYKRAIPLLEQAIATRTAVLGADAPNTLVSRNLLGTAHLHLGDLRQAIAVYEAVLKAREAGGGDELPTLITRDNLALAYSLDGRLERALPLLEGVVKRFEAAKGPDHPDTVTAKNNLAITHIRLGRPQVAIESLRPLLEAAEKKLGEDHPNTNNTRINLAQAYRAVGRLEDGIRLTRSAVKLAEVKLGAEHPQTLLALSNLGSYLTEAGRADLSLPLLERVWKFRAAQQGEDHPETLVVAHNLAATRLDAGDRDAALALQDKTLQLAEERRGGDHLSTLTFRDGYAEMLRRTGRTGEATTLFERNLRLAEAALGGDNLHTLKFRHSLGSVYWYARKFEAAIPLLRATLGTLEKKFSPDHPEAIAVRNTLGYAYKGAGRIDRAIPLLEESGRQVESQRGTHHPSLWLTWVNLSHAYQQAGRADRAVALFERVLAAVEAKSGFDDDYADRVRQELFRTYQAAGKRELVVRYYENAVRAQEDKLGRNNPTTVATRLNLAQAYQSAGMPDRAIPLLEQVVAAREADPGPDHPDTVAARSGLAFSLGSKSRWEEAVRLRERNAEAVRALPEADERRLAAQSALADALAGAKQFDRAIAVLEAVLRVRQLRLAVNPGGHPFELNATRNSLANVYVRAGRPREAIPLFEEVLRFNAGKWGGDNKSTLYAKGFLAQAHLGAGDAEAARRIYEELVPALDKQFPPTDVMPVMARRNWAAALDALGRHGPAVAVRQEIVGFERRMKSPSGFGLQMALEQLGETQLKAKRPAEAEATFREVIRLLEKPGVASPALFSAKSGLGAALAGQRKYEDAEPLLLAAFDGLKVLDAKLSTPLVRTRLLETADRLIAFYTATDRPDEVTKWRAERVGFPDVAPPPREKK